MDAGWGPGRRPGRQGRPRRGREPAETCAETTEQKGKLYRATHVPAGGGWGGSEGGWAGGREEPEGGTDGRDRGRAEWGRERRREEASWWKQRPSAPRPPQSPARQGSCARGPRGLSFPSRLVRPPATARAGLPRSPRRAPRPGLRPPQLGSRAASPGASRLPVGPFLAGSPHTVPPEEFHSRGILDGSSSPIGLHTPLVESLWLEPCTPDYGASAVCCPEPRTG